MMSRSRPRGYSLIEMVVVITGFTTLMTFSAALIHQMLRLERVERAGTHAASSLERLGRDLRADLHAASGPVERTDAAIVIPRGNGRTVEYRIRPKDLLRSVRDAGKTKGFETYARPGGTTATFSMTTDGPRVLVVLTMAPEAGRSTSGDITSQAYRIEAAPGRYDRLAKGVSP